MTNHKPKTTQLQMFLIISARPYLYLLVVVILKINQSMHTIAERFIF